MHGEDSEEEGEDLMDNYEACAQYFLVGPSPVVGRYGRLRVSELHCCSVPASGLAVCGGMDAGMLGQGLPASHTLSRSPPPTCSDYRPMEHLDHYEADGIDAGYVDGATMEARMDARASAEAALAARDRAEGRLTGRRRGLPAVLAGDSEEESEGARPRRRRRLEAAQEGEQALEVRLAVGQGVNKGLLAWSAVPAPDRPFLGMPASMPRGPPVPSSTASMPRSLQGEYEIDLDEARGPTREWVAREPVRREIKRRFAHFLRHYAQEGGDPIYPPLIRTMVRSEFPGFGVARALGGGGGIAQRCCVP